jgi:hypothetical protein
MAQNDNAVLTAAVGYVYKAAVGTARPTPAQIKTLDPLTFGTKAQVLKTTGSPTGGTFTLTVEAEESAALAHDADAAAIQAALEALATVGPGNVTVQGEDLVKGLAVSWVGTLKGSDHAITATPTLTGGTTPTVTVTATQDGVGWDQIGHTSRNDMPEFGFDGGDSEVKGTWQNAKLREVQSDAAADFLTMFLHQFDTENFELYYGKNASSTPGVFGVSGDVSKTNEYAFLVIIIDGDRRVGFYAPKASVKRDDSIQMPVDDFASLPIKATFLKNGNANLFEWINEELFA